MEDLNPVRKIREHLRLGSQLLAQGELDAASSEVAAALAVDPSNLPALALRERISNARSAAALAQATPSVTPAPPGRFVPTGVDAKSWMGFEQRIQERRFRALVESMRSAIATDDAVSARVALEEARELRPDAPELGELEGEIAALPRLVLPPVRDYVPWSRAAGALLLLLVGVSMIIGLETFRPVQPSKALPISAPAAAPLIEPASTLRSVDAEAPTFLPAGSDAVADDNPVSMGEDARMVEVGTAGVTPRLSTVASRRMPPAPTPRLLRQAAILEEPIAEEAVLTRGEVPDDFVAAAPYTPSGAPALSQASNATRAPLTSAAASNGPAPQAPPAYVPANAASTAAAARPGQDETRVADVLRRYAQAYGQLDAGAAREVWPSVDARALARAFDGLASQNLSFNDCQIDVRGATANASCRGQASYVGKVGSGEQKTEARTWRFELRRQGDAWKIENAEARRAGTSSH